MTNRQGAIIAIVIHVVIIVAILTRGRADKWSAGPDTLEGASRQTEVGGMPATSQMHSQSIKIVDERGAPVDSADVRQLSDDHGVLTNVSGAVTLSVRAGAVLVIRVRKGGYDEVTLRLANAAAENSVQTIRLARSAPAGVAQR